MSSGKLYHHGIKGQKWGVRRYQNPDGTLTPEGQARYNEGASTLRGRAEISKQNRRIMRSNQSKDKLVAERNEWEKRRTNAYDKKISRMEAKKARLESRIQKKEQKKKAFIDDYRMRTKAVERGYKKYADTIAKYRDAKVMSIKDKAYRHSEECQRIISEYHNQKLSDLMWGKDLTRLGYITDEARKM